MTHTEHLGADTMLYVEVPGAGLLTARILNDAAYNVRQTVELTPQSNRVYRFPRGRAMVG